MNATIGLGLHGPIVVFMNANYRSNKKKYQQKKINSLGPIVAFMNAIINPFKKKKNSPIKKKIKIKKGPIVAIFRFFL